MDGRTISLLSEYIAELHRRNRKDNRTVRQPGFNTTTEDDAYWDERNRGRDGRCGTDISGQDRDSI